MRLEIFDFIEETISVYEGKKALFREASKEVIEFIEDHFLELDNVINISARLKTCNSLKEKILRKDLYIKYRTPGNLISKLSDIIGLRIECRFIEDENDVYNKVMEFFDMADEEYQGYYYNQSNKNLLLKLSDSQPQSQKNGFHIYKIDGIYKYGDMNINFELQIKSMVNMFWGEVEHKVLYKNYKYMLSEDLFKNFMGALMQNLVMIDSQLIILNNHLKELDEPTKQKSQEQLESILAKIVYDIYSNKAKEEFGLVIDYRDACDTVITYVLRKNGENLDYEKHLFDLIEKISKLSKEELYIGNYMNFEQELAYEDDFSRRVGEVILKMLNKDFKWNLFFKIIFRLETGVEHTDFENFVAYFRDSFLFNLENNKDLNEKYTSDEKEEIMYSTMSLILEGFIKSRKVEFIANDNVENINEIINITIRKFTSFEMWKENQGYYKSELERAFISTTDD